MTKFLTIPAVTLLLAVACGPATSASPEATPPPTAVYLNTETYLDPGAPLPTPTMDPFCAEYLAELRQRFERQTGITDRFWGTDAMRLLQVEGYPGRREMSCLLYLEY